MYEMLCKPAVVYNTNRNPACVLKPPTPRFPPGPLVLQYLSGDSVGVYMIRFQGTIEFQNGVVEVYDTPTDITIRSLPDDGNGYCTMILRGVLDGGLSQYFNGYGYARKDLVDVWQWGEDCIIGDYRSFFFSISNPCVALSALDIPKFGLQENGDVYGTSCYDMFNRATYFNSVIGHWDVRNVTDVTTMFYNAFAFSQDISTWTYHPDVVGRSTMFN